MSTFDKVFLKKDDKLIYGKYRAIVKNIDDPEKLGRIQVQCIEIYGEDLSPWAWPSSLYGGSDNTGIFFLPEIDSGVWVEFEQGYITNPIWTGCWWTKYKGQNEVPIEVLNNYGITKIIKTSTGNFIALYDGDDPKIEIVDSSGNSKLIIQEDKIISNFENLDLIQKINQQEKSSIKINSIIKLLHDTGNYIEIDDNGNTNIKFNELNLTQYVDNQLKSLFEINSIIKFLHDTNSYIEINENGDINLNSKKFKILSDTNSYIEINENGDINIIGNNMSLPEDLNQIEQDISNIQGDISNIEQDIIELQKWEFGDVENGNYSYFEPDGTLVAKGEAITWRDEYVGGVYFVPSGASAPDEVNVTIGGVVTKKYSFDGVNIIEKLGNTFEIPHDMEITKVNSEEISVEFHLHIAPSDNVTTGDVRFVIDWCLIKVDGAPYAGNQLILTKSIIAGKQYHNCLTGIDLPIPSGSGGFGIGDLIEFTVSREPQNANDTYSADILFYKSSLHVPLDTLGSRQRYTK